MEIPIDVELDDVTGANRALTRTAFIPEAVSKLVPEMVREEPATAIEGENPEIVGVDEPTTKVVALVALPPGLVTTTGPDDAPPGTVAMI